MNITANMGPCSEEQRNLLNLHLASVRWCYNHALAIADRMMGEDPKAIKKAFHDLKPGSGFEDCSSYVCARARDEASWHSRTKRWVCIDSEKNQKGMGSPCAAVCSAYRRRRR